MSTTTVAPLKPWADENVKGFYDNYVAAWGDYDKAGDMESHAYYEGLIDAYYDVLVTLGAIDPEPEEASSVTETENDSPCEIVFDGNDTDGSVWNRCTVHGYLVFGDAPLCEGYRAAPYVESS